MKTSLYHIQSTQWGHLLDATGASLNQTYVTNLVSSLDQARGFSTQMGSPVGTILPFPPGTIGADVPFYWFGNAADHTPQAGWKRKKWLQTVLHSTDFILHTTLGPLTDPPATTNLFFSGNDSLDETPIKGRVRRRRQQSQAASAAQPGVTGIPISFINGSAYAAVSCKLLSEIQRHLLEPVIDEGVTWSLWTQDEVLNFFSMRLQRFLMETGLIRKFATSTATTGDNAYPSDTIEVRGMTTFNGGTYSPLVKIDPMQADNYYINWASTPGIPEAFIEEPQVSLTFNLVPAPISSIQVSIRYVPLPANITGVCAPLPIPNFFANFVKWGTIADMLAKEGEANDPQRAEIAESRFREGVELAKVLLGTKR